MENTGDRCWGRVMEGCALCSVAVVGSRIDGWIWGNREHSQCLLSTDFFSSVPFLKCWLPPLSLL